MSNAEKKRNKVSLTPMVLIWKTRWSEKMVKCTELNLFGRSLVVSITLVLVLVCAASAQSWEKVAKVVEPEQLHEFVANEDLNKLSLSVLSLSLPPGFKRDDVKCIDSACGKYSRGLETLWIDVCRCAGDPVESVKNLDSYLERWMYQRNLLIRLYKFYDGKTYIIGASIRDKVKGSPIASVSIRSSKPLDTDGFESIVQSIQVVLPEKNKIPRK